MTRLKSVVSDASVRPSSPPPPPPKTIGYQGEPQKQKKLEEVLKEYPDDLQIRNSGPTGIPLRRVPKAAKKVTPRPPTCLSPSEETKRSLVTKGAQSIWEAAEQLDLEWRRERETASSAD